MDHLGYKVALDNIRTIYKLESWISIILKPSPSCNVWIHELEFKKSMDSRSRISKSRIWEFGTSIWPFWGLKSAHDCLNFKAKGFESKLIQISLRHVGSTNVVVCKVLRSNRLGPREQNVVGHMLNLLPWVQDMNILTRYQIDCVEN